jgi:hypothetical protein
MNYDMWVASLLIVICANIAQNFLEVNSCLDHMPMFTTSSDQHEQYIYENMKVYIF